MRSLEDLLDVAVRSTRAAATLIVDWTERGDALEIAIKGEGDYVTAADHAAERAAIDVLRELTPGIAVVAEESGGVREDLMWVVDPIDGTTNFTRGYPEVGVSVALVEDGLPVVGAVAAPFHRELWSAARGCGAHDTRGRRLAVRPPAGMGVLATGIPFRVRRHLPRYLPVLDSVVDRFEDIRRGGAASLDLAYSAAGSWDGYFELGLGLWDIAAGALLVTEAGGVVTDWEGDPGGVFVSGDILAGAPATHERILAAVRAAAA